MDFSSFLDRVPDLTDLELAVLLCLVAREHSIIETVSDAVEDLEKELRLITAGVFGLSCAVLDCSPEFTVDDFNNGILDPYGMNLDWKYDSRRLSTPRGADIDTNTDSFLQSQPARGRSKSPLPESSRGVANVVIAKNFNHCPAQVQIQALEVEIPIPQSITPKVFHFIALMAVDGDLPATLNCHFRDHIFLSHFHDPNDGFANMEDDSSWFSEDQESTSSVIRKSITGNNAIQIEVLNPYAFQLRGSIASNIIKQIIDLLRQLSEDVTISAEVNRYMQDIVVFLRLHRAVAGGISAKATNYLNRLVRCLAPLHSIDYVTPSLVALAAKKIYRHRITLSAPTNDRSLQYGSDLKAAEEYLLDISPDVIIEEVLAEVEVPVNMSGQLKNSRGEVFDDLTHVAVPSLPAHLSERQRGRLRRDYTKYAKLCHVQDKCHTDGDLAVARQFCNAQYGRRWSSDRMLSDTIAKLGGDIRKNQGDPSLVRPAPPTTSVRPAVVSASATQGRRSARTGRALAGGAPKNRGGSSRKEATTPAADQQEPDWKPLPHNNPLAIDNWGTFPEQLGFQQQGSDLGVDTVYDPAGPSGLDIMSGIGYGFGFTHWYGRNLEDFLPEKPHQHHPQSQHPHSPPSE
ncbi:hypothetical protein FQN54_006893 [Arachnomyces sp. PD_36]|nr:hypothetical protein FQN54_006893 [Arachnomyces sp. PD_36]